jgi:hypothetical protein
MSGTDIQRLKDMLQDAKIHKGTISSISISLPVDHPYNIHDFEKDIFGLINLVESLDRTKRKVHGALGSYK